MCVASGRRPGRRVGLRPASRTACPTRPHLPNQPRGDNDVLRQIFDDKLAQYAYLVGCQATGEALVIDPERDVDRYVEMAERGPPIIAGTETHIHADFLSGLREFAERTGAKLYLSDEGGSDWQYDWAQEATTTSSLLKDGDTFRSATSACRRSTRPVTRRST